MELAVANGLRGELPRQLVQIGPFSLVVARKFIDLQGFFVIGFDRTFNKQLEACYPGQFLQYPPSTPTFRDGPRMTFT